MNAEADRQNDFSGIAGWNFGSHADSEDSVAQLVEKLARHGGDDAGW